MLERIIRLLNQEQGEFIEELREFVMDVLYSLFDKADGATDFVGRKEV
jgi:histone H3/H4